MTANLLSPRLFLTTIRPGRFAPIGPLSARSGRADPSGLRQFVVGTGGAEFKTFGAAQPNSELRKADSNGVLKLTLHDASYDWEFIVAVVGSGVPLPWPGGGSHAAPESGSSPTSGPGSPPVSVLGAAETTPAEAPAGAIPPSSAPGATVTTGGSFDGVLGGRLAAGGVWQADDLGSPLPAHLGGGVGGPVVHDDDRLGEAGLGGRGRPAWPEGSSPRSWPRSGPRRWERLGPWTHGTNRT